MSGRREATWIGAFWVDGSVDGRQAEVVRAIDALVVEPGRTPGPTGTFGGLTFSHDLVHYIGGNDDTNINTTRRILLLLESTGLLGEEVRTRVLRALLYRYVGEDVSYHEARTFEVPRFLPNDYVRYWRTMAVDSGQKRRERADKWALRNIKLRLSRKLIFTAGLWACLSCELAPSSELTSAREANDPDATVDAMTSVLLQFSLRSPLETLARMCVRYGQAAIGPATAAFTAYDEFLALLDDKTSRDRLAKLKVDEAPSDPTFAQAKKIAADFQKGLSTLFFDTDDHLKAAVQEYGVF